MKHFLITILIMVAIVSCVHQPIKKPFVIISKDIRQEVNHGEISDYYYISAGDNSHHWFQDYTNKYDVGDTIK